MTRPEVYIQIFIRGVSEDLTPEQGKELQAAIRAGDEWWHGENAYGGSCSVRCSSIDCVIECTPETRVAYHDSVIENKKAVEEATAYPGEVPE